jgi:hypothetical protein
MSKTTLAAGTSPFAHLLAIVTGRPASAKKAEDETPDNVDPDAEEDEDKPEAEEDKPEEDAEDDKPDEGDGKKGKRAKAKAEEPDDEEKAESDDDDEDMAKARHEGMLAQQARGRKIFSSASAALRPDMAAHLAFNETMSAAKAIGMLDMAASGTVPATEAGSRLGRRMAKVVLPNPGTGGSGARKSEEMSFGEMAKAAAEKAGIFKS